MKNNTNKLVTTAIIGALYAALTMAFGFCSYGTIQFRIAEVLCVLPFFFPPAAVGLTIGCIIANLISVAGVLDIVFGSFATLLAGLCTAWIGIKVRKKQKEAETAGEISPMGWGISIAVCAMPVIFNVPIVGAMLAYVFPLESFWQSFLIYGAQVGFGEATVMFILGLPAFRYMLKSATVKRLFAEMN